MLVTLAALTLWSRVVAPLLLSVNAPKRVVWPTAPLKVIAPVPALRLKALAPSMDPVTAMSPVPAPVVMVRLSARVKLLPSVTSLLVVLKVLAAETVTAPE